MKYKVGMYGGAFDPLHSGHIYNIIKAASVCEELYIVISWCKNRDWVNKEIRYRWILNSFRHLNNIKIVLVEDNAESKQKYGEDYWKTGAEEIKSKIGKTINAVFCGSDYLGSNRFESLYSPDSEIIYFSRDEISISSTEIRNNVFQNWCYIPAICRPYYVKRILVVGGESTGKSTLVQNLALAYNTNFVKEVGRETCEYAGSEELMVKEDLLENIIRQKADELQMIKNSNKLLFVDTDALTTKFYSSFLLGEYTKDAKECSDLADALHTINSWDLVLFLETDVEFVQDGTRNEDIKSDREKYSNQLKSVFDNKKVKYHCISGSYIDRFNKAKEIIKSELRVDII